MKKLLITGASGYIGKALVDVLIKRGQYELVLTSRTNISIADRSVSYVNMDISSEDCCWAECLDGVDCVVHLAGRAHVVKEKCNDPLLEFRKVNCLATLHIAQQAIDHGVKRFVFLSSIGVNGVRTEDTPFSETSLPNPSTDYARSKYEAELELQELFKVSSAELVIIRPPLVYAGHAPGNFARMLKLVHMGLPLPFGLVVNKRSMICLENLLDFVLTCVEHPAAANELFVISDGVDLSTADIVLGLAVGMGKRIRLLPVPDGIARAAAQLLGKGALYDQLFGSLVVDSCKARRLLCWDPPDTPPKALLRAGRDYKFNRDTGESN